MIRLIGYSAGVHPDEIERQAGRIRRAVGTRPSWRLVRVVGERLARECSGRRHLDSALLEVRRGRADGLIVTSADRLVDSLPALESLITEAHRDGWILVSVDDQMDLSTLDGRSVIAGIHATVRLQSALHGGQISSGMARAKARGLPIGAPPRIPEATVRLVVALHLTGLSAGAICGQLNAGRVDTPKKGGVWTPAKVNGLLRRQHAARLIAGHIDRCPPRP